MYRQGLCYLSQYTTESNDNCSDDVKIRATILPDQTAVTRSTTGYTVITGNIQMNFYKSSGNRKEINVVTKRCNFTITIRDCKKPTPYCINGIATVVMPVQDPSRYGLKILTKDL